MARNYTRTEHKVGDWLDIRYPTAIYHFIYGCAWFITLLGIVLASLSHWSHSAYDLFVGLVTALAGSITATVSTLWAHNEVGLLRQRARREHPSYPYRSR